MLTTNGLLPARTFAIAFRPAIIAPCSPAAAQFSTSATPTKVQRTTQCSPLLASRTPLKPLTFSLRRASTVNPTTSASSRNAAPSSSPGAALTWNRFLELRRTRRKISVAASSISAVTTTYFGLQAFMRGGYDSMLSASLGVDPIFAAGFSTLGFLAMGWLIGPFFGGMAFNTMYRDIKPDIEAKERAFYNRIKRHRVDPTSSSMANPVPDYYGEKIGSVADYRRWLKDQRAFNLKRGAYQGNK